MGERQKAMTMKKKTEFLLVETQALPDVFNKVVEAKKLLTLNSRMSVNEAALKTGISRSAFYKYKDKVFPFHETARGKIVTLYFVVDDFSGILSAIINKIAAAHANILTINQNIPINALADVTISVETEGMIKSMTALTDSIKKIDGVRRAEILSRD
jgi:chorismate mutase